MMKKEKTLRMAVTGALLLTVVAAGISMYRTDTTPKKESKAQQEEESKDVTSKDAEAQDTGELAKNTTENQEATPSPTMNQDNSDNAIPPAQEDENGQETADARESADTSAAVQPELNFTEDSQMLWPVNGQVVIDYSMDATTYFPTLDQYKYNDALMLGCQSGEPVQAAANGQVVSISEDVETGTTTQIGMSRSYFSTRFKEITGDTFHNYVISRKMQAAARKMAKGTENITQIASDLGYDNFYYFTKVFSKEYGCTPTEYAGRLKKCSI